MLSLADNVLMADVIRKGCVCNNVTVPLFVSDVIGNLTKLEELDLSNNQLAHFPEGSIGPNVSTGGTLIILSGGLVPEI